MGNLQPVHLNCPFTQHPPLLAPGIAIFDVAFVCKQKRGAPLAAVIPRLFVSSPKQPYSVTTQLNVIEQT